MNLMDESAIDCYVCRCLSHVITKINRDIKVAEIFFPEKFISGFDSTHLGRSTCLSMREFVSAPSNRSCEKAFCPKCGIL